MSGELFQEWVEGLDNKFLAQKRKVALVVDNCPSHLEVENLNAIKLVFLSLNTTSKTQPMDQGVIRSLKAKYVFVQKYSKAVDQPKFLPKTSILDAIDILAASWSMVSETTIVNCFAKAGLSSENQHQAESDEDDPFKDLVEELTKLQNRDQEIAPEKTSAEEFIDCDDQILARAALPTEDEIIAELIDEEVVEVEDSKKDSQEDSQESNDNPLIKPTTDEIRDAIKVISRYSLFSEYREVLREHCVKMNGVIEKKLVKKRKK